MQINVFTKSKILVEIVKHQTGNTLIFAQLITVPVPINKIAHRLKTKLRITLSFLFIAAIFGLLLRMMLAGTPLHHYKYLMHTHSHIALLGWLYNASLLLLQYYVFKKVQGRMNVIFWISQATFVGMMLSFPFQGYGLYSITFSTLYLFASYYLVYQMFVESRVLKSEYVAKFIRWGGVYLVLSSFGPFTLGAIMANGLEDTFWYKLAIYWFIHFLYNGFFVFVVFAYLLSSLKQVKNQQKIFLLMNFSVLPLYSLSILWMEPAWPFYLVSMVAATMQLGAFLLILRGQSLKLSTGNTLAYKLFILALIAYGLKTGFQLFASFRSVQQFLSATVSSAIIGYVHLVMLGFFTLFFLAVFIRKSALRTTGTLLAGVVILVVGIVLSEILLFGQSISTYFRHESIPNYHSLLFWVSTLMPLGILLISLQKIMRRE